LVPHRHADLSNGPEDARSAVLIAAVAAQTDYLERNELGVCLGTIAELWKQVALADLVYIAEVAWSLEGEARITEGAAAVGPILAGIVAPEQPVRSEWLHPLLSNGRHILGAGRNLPIDSAALDSVLFARVSDSWPSSRSWMVPIRFRGKVVAVALVAHLRPPGRRVPDVSALQVLAGIIANVVSLHRRFESHRHSLIVQVKSANRWQRFARVSADALWEARPDGQIEVLVPLSERLTQDVRMALLRATNAVLDTESGLTICELVDSGQDTRHISATLTLPDYRQSCWLSMQAMLDDQGDERIVGSLFLREQPAEAKPGADLMDMILRLDRVREREHQLRQEAETLLQGLRILTGAASSSEMFRDLLDLLGGVIGVESACLVKRHWQGKLMTAETTDPALDSVDWQELAPLLEALPDSQVTLAAADELLSSIDGQARRPWQSAIVAPLRIARERGWLICLHSMGDAFHPHHVSLMDSLMLLTQQALVQEDQRNQLIQSTKLAAVGSMMAGIAHEINQPLNAIALAAHNLASSLSRDGAGPNDSSVKKCERIGDQVKRIHAMTQKMRSFVRRSAGAVEAFLPTDHIENVVVLVGPHMKDCGVELHYENAEDACFVLGDSTQFEQVVANLVVNAADSVFERRAAEPPDATLPGRIQVSFRRDPDHRRLEIAFCDNGAGFDQTALTKAFDPFFTTKEVGKGTGLGLSISYSIMANMGGGVRIENWENGAIVTLWLPTTG